MKFKLVALGLLVGLVMLGCQQGISSDVEQRLTSLEARPIPNIEGHHQLWSAEFKRLDSRITILEEPNPYLIAAGIFYGAFLRKEAGDITGEAEVLQAVMFDAELTELWREVLTNQRPVHHFSLTLWSKAFAE